MRMTSFWPTSCAIDGLGGRAPVDRRAGRGGRGVLTAAAPSRSRSPIRRGRGRAGGRDRRRARSMRTKPSGHHDDEGERDDPQPDEPHRHHGRRRTADRGPDARDAHRRQPTPLCTHGHGHGPSPRRDVYVCDRVGDPGAVERGREERRARPRPTRSTRGSPSRRGAIDDRRRDAAARPTAVDDEVERRAERGLDRVGLQGVRLRRTDWRMSSAADRGRARARAGTGGRARGRPSVAVPAVSDDGRNAPTTSGRSGRTRVRPPGQPTWPSSAAARGMRTSAVELVEAVDEDADRLVRRAVLRGEEPLDPVRRRERDRDAVDGVGRQADEAAGPEGADGGAPAALVVGEAEGGHRTIRNRSAFRGASGPPGPAPRGSAPRPPPPRPAPRTGRRHGRRPGRRASRPRARRWPACSCRCAGRRSRAPAPAGRRSAGRTSGRRGPSRRPARRTR